MNKVKILRVNGEIGRKNAAWLESVYRLHATYCSSSSSTVRYMNETATALL